MTSTQETNTIASQSNDIVALIPQRTRQQDLEFNLLTTLSFGINVVIRDLRSLHIYDSKIFTKWKTKTNCSNIF